MALKKTTMQGGAAKTQIRRNKVHSPGSGGFISGDAYKTLSEIYAQTGSVSQSAQAAGVSLATARKYIEEGSSKFPAIKDVMQEVEIEEAQAAAERIRQTKQMFQDSASSLAARCMEAITAVAIHPRTRRVKIHGVKQHAMDENAVAKIARALNSLYALFEQAAGQQAPHSTHPISITNNIGIGGAIDPKAAAAEAHLVTRILSTRGKDADFGKFEEQVRTAIMEEVTGRPMHTAEAVPVPEDEEEEDTLGYNPDVEEDV